jgi:hypothetical protein
MYIKLIDGTPVRASVTDVIRANPQVSFPKHPIPASALEPFGLFPCAPTQQPAYDPATHKVVEGTPAQVNGAWLQVWDVVQLTAEEIAELTANEASAVRNQRNGLLAECDWTQLSDAQVDAAAWATYRQALRDITKQAGFPWSVLWPSRPDN